MGLEKNNNFENKSLRQLETEKVLAESNKNKDELKENISQSIINKLNSTEGYTVRNKDILSLINKITSKGNHINFNDKGNEIIPNDKIRIVSGKVFKNDEVVGNVTNGFKKIDKIINTNKSIVEETKKGTNDVKKELTDTSGMFINEKENDKKIILNPVEKDIKDIFENKLNITKEDKNNLVDIKNNETVQEINTIIDYKKSKKNSTILGNGPKIESGETIVENNNSSEFQEKLLEKTNSPQLKMILAISQIWIDSARKAAGEQWSLMGLSDDKEIIEEGIELVTNDLNTIINIIQDKDKDISEINTYINSIFKYIYKVENEGENIIDDIKKIRLLFNGLDDKNYDERLAKLLKFSSGGFNDGNTQKSKEIAKNIIINKHFPEAKDAISKIKDFDSLDAVFFQNLGIKSPILSKQIAEEVRETYTEVKSTTEKNRNTILEQFKKANPDYKENITTAVDEIIRKTASMQARTMAENSFIENSVHTLKGNDNIVKTFNDLNSNTQATKEWLADNGLMIALSLIPMGAGFAAVGLASKGASIAMKGKTLADYGNKMRIAGNSAKGIVFYEGMNLTNNAIYQDNFSMELLDGSLNSKELVRNALFFNIMGIASKWIPSGEKMLSAQTMKSISAEALAFTGIDLGVEFGFEGEMSLEQFRHSLLTGGLMTIMSRGAGRINKNTRGIEFKKGEEIFYHKKTGNKYTKNSEGEFINEKGKVSKNLKEENLSKEKKYSKEKSKEEVKNKEEVNKVASEVGESIFKKIFSQLSPSGKAKIAKNGGESQFIKDFQEKLWGGIKKDYDGGKHWFTGTLKLPFKPIIFGFEQIGKNALSPAWKVSTALNPIKFHQNLTWTDKMVGGMTASMIYEGMSIAINDDEKFLDPKHLANIPLNAVQLSLFGFWTIASEPLVNTLYGQFKGFEERDFVPAYFDNIYGNIRGKSTPYETGESLVPDDKEILMEVIKQGKIDGYEPKLLEKLQENLDNL